MQVASKPTPPPQKKKIKQNRDINKQIVQTYHQQNKAEP